MQPILPLIFSQATVFLPAILLTTVSDADREFLTQIYLDYRNLIYRVALTFFPDDHCEAEDAFSNTLEKLCKRPELLRSIADAQKASAPISSAAIRLRTWASAARKNGKDWKAMGRNFARILFRRLAGTFFATPCRRCGAAELWPMCTMS